MDTKTEATNYERLGRLVQEAMSTAPTLSTIADEITEAAKDAGVPIWAPDDDENPYTAVEGRLCVEEVDLNNDRTEADAWSLTGWAIIERGGSDEGLVAVYADEDEAQAALAVLLAKRDALSPSAALREIAATRPCLDADTTSSDLAYWARTSIIPTLEKAGLL